MAQVAGREVQRPTDIPPRDQGAGSLLRQDLIGLTRPINKPWGFLFSKLSSVSHGTEEPGGKPCRPCKWNSKSSLPGDYQGCDLVVKIKECRKSEEPEPAAPKPAPPKPVPPEPTPPEPPETPGLSEDCSEGPRTPAGSLTLQVRPSPWPDPHGEGASLGKSTWASSCPHLGAWRLNSLRNGCVTLGRSPDLSGPLFDSASDGEMMSTLAGLD